VKTPTVRAATAAASGALRAAFELAPGGPVRPASTLRLLTTEASLFTSLHALVDGALTTIDARFYMVLADSEGRRFTNALLDARRRGVTVRLVVDELGSPSAGPLVEELLEGGCEVRVFHSLADTDLLDLDRRDHAKLLLRDRKVAWVASANVGDAYASWFNDAGVTLGGEVVEDLVRDFDTFWRSLGSGDDHARAVPRARRPEARAAGQGLPIRVVQNTPNRFALAGHVEAMLLGAKHRIDVHHCYLTNAEVLRVLALRARGGVKVTVIVPEESDVPAVGLVVEASLDPLLDAGVRVVRLSGRSHRKVLLVDRGWLLLGSGNLDDLSLRQNLEVCVAVYSGTVGLLATALLFAADQRGAHALTRSPLRCWKRPLARLLSWLRPWL